MASSLIERFEPALDAIADGELIETAATRANVSAKTLRQYAAKDAEFGAAYTRARLISADILADEALRVARACTALTYAADRVRIDTLKWAAAKRNPASYGDKLDVTSGGEKIAQAVVVMPPEQIPEADYEVVEAPQTPLTITSGELETPENAQKDAI